MANLILAAMIIEAKEKHLFYVQHRTRKNIYLFAYSQRTDIFIYNDKKSPIKQCMCISRRIFDV